MTAPRLTRREIVLVCITALACFAVAIPLSRASADRSQRQFTIWPGSSARFANMDWNCDYYAATETPASNAQVMCARESTPRGLRTTVEGNYLSVNRCGGGSGDTLGWCNKLLRKPRTP